VTLARNLKKKSTQKAFFRDAGIVSSEAAQRDARTMGGTSPRDSAPGKRPRGSRVERKSVSCSEKKASAKPRAPPSVLTDASDLVFGKVVGRGTQGTVRLAKHRTTGKRFVVKLLPLETHGYAIASGRAMDLPCDPMSMTDDDARRVVAEAEVLKLASDHPNVVRFHGAFTREVAPSSSSRRTSEHLASGHASVSAARDDPSCDTTAAPSPSSPRASELCIVMSHCEGGDLASLLRRVKQAGPHALLPEDVVMRWLVQLLLGLNHIHRKAILHRDIKPANVFLSKSRKVVRLGDFGIAKKLREDDDLATTVVGTPLYMSPELCQGKPYTYASDIWALGCVAYEMASGGAKAFDAPGWPQLLVKIVRCDYAPVPSHLSRPFAALIASMLSPDPAERPTTEQLLSTPIVRRHCEALLRDARDAKNVFGAESAAADGVAAEASARPGRSSRSSGASSVTTAAFGVSGVAAEKHRSAREGRHVNAAAAADAEKRAAAEARYAARQNALRRDRMAVRDADPKRLAARDRADAEAEKRMARQEARATAEAEAALLVARGYAAPEGCFAQKKKRPARWMEPRERRGRHASPKKTLPRGGHSCAAKPRSRRARGWTAPRWSFGLGTEKGGSNAASCAESDFPESFATGAQDSAAASASRLAEEDASAFFSSDVSAATGAAADAETALMELLLAEARDDMKAATETATEALTEADVDAVVDAVAAETESPETSETRVDIVSRAAAASAAAALLGRRAGTAPGGARATPEGRRAVSASFEWPPPALTSERQAMKDAALERRVRAKLRTFLREELGAGDVSSAGTETRGLNSLLVRPATAVGTRDASSSVCEDAMLASASSLDASDASYGSDDFENSGDFEAFFEGGEDARRAFRESRVE
jgi:NIMA (never in mitosis gene a)-related kinase